MLGFLSGVAELVWTSKGGENAPGQPLSNDPVSAVANAAIAPMVPNALAPATNNHTFVKYLVQGGALSSVVLLVMGVISNSLLNTTGGALSLVGGIAGMYAVKKLAYCESLEQDKSDLANDLEIAQRQLGERKQLETEREKTTKTLLEAEAHITQTTAQHIQERKKQAETIKKLEADLAASVQKIHNERVAAETMVQQIANIYHKQETETLAKLDQALQEVDRITAAKDEATRDIALLQGFVKELGLTSEHTLTQLNRFGEENRQFQGLITSLQELSPSSNIDMGTISAHTQDLTAAVNAFNQSAGDVLLAKQECMQTLAAVLPGLLSPSPMKLSLHRPAITSSSHTPDTTKR